MQIHLPNMVLDISLDDFLKDRDRFMEEKFVNGC